MNEDHIEIPLSRKKLTVLLAGAVVFVLACIWLFIFAADYTDDVEVIRLITGIGALFFGYIGFTVFQKLSNKALGVFIDERGITDNSNATSIGLITWDDITAVETIKVSHQKFIMVRLKDPEKYISRGKNKFVKKNMHANLKLYGSPIMLISNTLKCTHKQLCMNVFDAFKKHSPNA